MRSEVLLLAGVLGLACSGSMAATAPLALQCGDTYDSRGAKLIGPRTIVTGADGRIAQLLPGKANVPGAAVVDLPAGTHRPPRAHRPGIEPEVVRGGVPLRRHRLRLPCARLR